MEFLKIFDMIEAMIRCTGSGDKIIIGKKNRNILFSDDAQ